MVDTKHRMKITSGNNNFVIFNAEGILKIGNATCGYRYMQMKIVT